MKIVLTGGGTGGHFYPLVAVAEQLNEIIDKENIADTRVYFFAPEPYNKEILYETSIRYRHISAGKLRLYPSIKNITGLFKTAFGILQALFQLVAIYPDVVFSKGGYGAFPTVVAARILGIPIIIHESDSVPGRVNQITGRFARTVAVSYEQEAEYFDIEKIVHTGQPIRSDLQSPSSDGAYEFLGLDKDVPVLWVVGGSLGAKILNDVTEEALPALLPKFQIIHQTGEKNFEHMKKLTDALLADNEFKNRYHPFPTLNKLSLKMVAAITDVVVTRAGSMLFEIAHWRIPAIVVPITHSNKNHQIKNAYNFARAGAGVVIEENNLSDHLLAYEINRLYDDKGVRTAMIRGAESFDIPNAAHKIAQEIIAIGFKHDE